MGVLNTTPDSFSDGGRVYADGRLDVSAAIAAAEAMVQAGAAVIDVGGESTRPGAEPVSQQAELDRVLPVVEKLADSVDAVISVDTSSPRLMREAAALGAGMLNDVRALSRDGALQAASDSGLPVCLMHMQGTPVTMQSAPRYNDVVDEVMAFLQQRSRGLRRGGYRTRASDTGSRVWLWQVGGAQSAVAGGLAATGAVWFAIDGRAVPQVDDREPDRSTCR